ncbi:MAG: polysaccharide deacetylase family protein [Acidimicrobiia bacterium]
MSPPEEAPWLHPGLISASPESFAQQMEFLAAHYPVVSLDDVLGARLRQRRLAPRSVLITFDDAYADFADHAWPVLRRLGLPVTMFVPTAFPGDPERRFWWDRLHHAFTATDRRAPVATLAGTLPMETEADRRRSWAGLRRHLKAMPHDEFQAEVDRLEAVLDAPASPPGSVLSWSQINRLMAQGVTVAAHTRTHPQLDRLPRQRLRDEILGSIEDLRRETGRAPSAFAYPGGALDDEVVQAAQDAGVALGFTTRPGLNDLRHGNWLRLRRLNVGRSATPALLRLRLLPALARLDRPARPSGTAPAREAPGAAWVHGR